MSQATHIQYLVPDTDVLAGVLDDIEKQVHNARRSIKYWTAEVERLRDLGTPFALDRANSIEKGKLDKEFTRHLRYSDQAALVSVLLDAASH